ncbi:MAG: transcription repressor NadR [Actinomycetia bacterium]|jgi:transcriptional regulator of NAD metabolism|nr:transcription repressor NadR [Actinomycetes bacterium]
MRRQRILELLQAAQEPVPGAVLAEALGVSRQAIVHDVAVLRAQGAPIEATTRGYVLPRPSGVTAVFMVRHPPEATAAELYALVDAGLTVVDVLVEHPIYGELRGGLDLQSRHDVDVFLARIGEDRRGLLSRLTGGLHWHTVRGRDAEAVARGRAALQALGIWLDEAPNR